MSHANSRKRIEEVVDARLSATTPVPCVLPAQVANGATVLRGCDGYGYTVTQHPSALLTNNAAPFIWNISTQSGNIPAVVVTQAGNTLTITVGDVITNYTPNLGTEIFVQAGAYDPNTNLLTLTLTDGSTVDINLSTLLTDTLSNLPAVSDGLTASAGTGLLAAREDHVHPFTHALLLTQSDGLKYTHNGNALTVAIPAGVIAQNIGFNAAGNPVRAQGLNKYSADHDFVALVPLVITHNLNLTDPLAYFLQAREAVGPGGGDTFDVTVTAVAANSITLVSNTSKTGVRVTIVG